MLQWRELRADERESWYRDKLRRDFPADELKPRAMIEKLIGQGRYHCYGFFDEAGHPAAYAYTMECEEYVLLDYLAVEPDARGQGIGSQVLPLLGEMIGGRTMLIEAENPPAPGAFPIGTPGRPASGFTEGRDAPLGGAGRCLRGRVPDFDRRPGTHRRGGCRGDDGSITRCSRKKSSGGRSKPGSPDGWKRRKM